MDSPFITRAAYALSAAFHLTLSAFSVHHVVGASNLPDSHSLPASYTEFAKTLTFLVSATWRQLLR